MNFNNNLTTFNFRFYGERRRQLTNTNCAGKCWRNNVTVFTKNFPDIYIDALFYGQCKIWDPKPVCVVSPILLIKLGFKSFLQLPNSHVITRY